MNISNNSNLKSLDILVGLYDTYLVIDTTSKFTTEVLNLRTMEEETIEGDYLDNGDLSSLGLTNKGNFELYLDALSRATNEYKNMVRAKAIEVCEFYFD